MTLTPKLTTTRTNKKQMVSEYAWRWLARKMPDLKPSTRHRYGEQVRMICDGLGHIKMAELSPDHVSTWLAMLPEHFSGWTCNGVLRVLRVMTRDAKADLRLVHWACDRVKGTRPQLGYSDEEPNALTGPQLGRLFVAMREHEPAWFPLFATMALTGMRFAEASALQWKDLDFDAGTIRVRRNQYRGMISSPKTRNSKRAIPIVEDLAAVLRTHHDAVMAHNPLAEWVFPSAANKPHHSGALSDPIRRCAAIAEIPTRITPHGLRRTLNTLALQVAPAETIRLILGHVTTEMTERYNAPSLDVRRDVLARVTETMDRPTRTPAPSTAEA